MNADLNRTQLLALVESYQYRYFKDVAVVEDPQGRSAGHMAWMLARVYKDVTEGTMVMEKANRWLGYVQGYLVLADVASLEDMKDSVRRFKND